jgi:SAM-dependent methyltransferase
LFYPETMLRLLAAKEISIDDAVLVVCGGPYDAEVLAGLGFRHVVITNLGASVEGDTSGFPYESADAENLPYPEDAFDVVIVHAGLHHCPSPHRALIEMYRVARKVAIAFEARDSALMRLAVCLGFTNDFELEAVTGAHLETGGLNNGPIPNLNYRWDEREVTKVVRAVDPAHVERIRFFYGLRLPTLRFKNVNAPARRLALNAAAPVVRSLVSLFPKQGNEFGFAVFKTRELRAWLEIHDGKPRVSREQAERRGQAYTLPHERKT